MLQVKVSIGGLSSMAAGAETGAGRKALLAEVEFHANDRSIESGAGEQLKMIRS